MSPTFCAKPPCMGLPQKSGSRLDRVSTGSGSDLVKPQELITDQVATAPCTDPIQQ